MAQPAIANAIGTVGADYSSVYFNPAGIGLFRKGDFSYSASLGEFIDRTKYLNEENISKKYNVSVEQIKKWNNLQSEELSIGQELIISK